MRESDRTDRQRLLFSRRPLRGEEALLQKEVDNDRF
jgi:hypothetical protein